MRRNISQFFWKNIISQFFFIITVLPVKTCKNAILCVCFIFWVIVQSYFSTQGAYQNDHQPSLIPMVVLIVKYIASRETKGHV